MITHRVFELDGSFVDIAGWCFFATDTATVDVVEVDIDIAGLTEVTEDTVGGLVVRNCDGNEAPRKQISLSVAPAGWNGNLVFSHNGEVHIFTAASGGDEIVGNTTIFAASSLPHYLYVEGWSASGEMRDVTITLSLQGVNGCEDSVKFTVLWVEPVEVRFTSIVSTYDDKRDNYKNWTVANTYDLGGPQLYNSSYGARTGWGTEAEGVVKPWDFSYPGASLKLERDAQSCIWDGTTRISGNEFTAPGTFTPRSRRPTGQRYRPSRCKRRYSERNWNHLRLGRPGHRRFRYRPCRHNLPKTGQLQGICIRHYRWALHPMLAYHPILHTVLNTRNDVA